MRASVGHEMEGRLAMVRRTPNAEPEAATVVAFFEPGNGPSLCDGECVKLRLKKPWPWKTMVWKPTEYCYRMVEEVELV